MKLRSSCVVLGSKVDIRAWISARRRKTSPD
jgi:hypothetical protein